MSTKVKTTGGFDLGIQIGVKGFSEVTSFRITPSDGEILFVNVFGGSAPGSGMTCAITGPWRSGPL